MVIMEIDPKIAASFFNTRIKHLLNYNKMTAKEFGEKVSVDDLRFVIYLVQGKVITQHEGELALREKLAKPDELIEMIIAGLL